MRVEHKLADRLSIAIHPVQARHDEAADLMRANATQIQTVPMPQFGGKFHSLGTVITLCGLLAVGVLTTVTALLNRLALL